MATSSSQTSGLNVLATNPVSRPSAIAKLHVRLSNIGSEGGKSDHFAKVGTTRQCVLYDYHSTLKARPIHIVQPSRVGSVKHFEVWFDIIYKSSNSLFLCPRCPKLILN